jgi:FtsP/CotA-like multicopper oxidase with cupredoxin domain
VNHSAIRRRTLIRGVGGLVGLGAFGGLGACSGPPSALVGPRARAVADAEARRRIAGRSVVSARLVPQVVTVDLGGRQVGTWAYGEGVPGPVLRATAGDLVRLTVDNKLPTSTSVHCHGIALRNDMDGAPGLTQDPIQPGSRFVYEFTAPDPGTYYYHPHSGVQLDRGLAGALIIDDPAEPGDYDAEWVVVLDDWIDGTGTDPDRVLAGLIAGGGGGSMMGGSVGPGSRLLGGSGAIDYPHYLVNGRTADAPATFTGKPGQRVRIRLINAGSDTAFRVALGGHELHVTHSDGFPVADLWTDAVMLGMGERYDVLVTLGDGVFALVAAAEGKVGQALALVRTGAGSAPPADVRLAELDQRVLLGTDLTAADAVRLPDREVDRRHTLRLGGSMMGYRWTINGRTHHDAEPLEVREGERVRLRFTNGTMMFHPMHVHGHTFALREGGSRKDTIIVRPMETIEVDLDADNPGQWMTHCHNIYHAEAGMMTTLSYRA